MQTPPEALTVKDIEYDYSKLKMSPTLQRHTYDWLVEHSERFKAAGMTGRALSYFSFIQNQPRVMGELETMAKNHFSNDVVDESPEIGQVTVLGTDYRVGLKEIVVKQDKFQFDLVFKKAKQSTKHL